MSNVEIFENNQFGQVRTLKKQGKIFFVAKDVCNALDIKNTTQAVNRLEVDERAMFNIGSAGKTNFVNEYGLYNLVLGSRKPEAKQFKRWITHEVIPEIRKKGQYINKPQSVEDLIIMQAQSIKEMKEKVEKVEGEVKSVKDSMAQIDENWRDYVNNVFSKIGRETGEYSDYRKESYILLDRRAHSDIEKRLENKRRRMKKNGATKTAINQANKLDVIEEDHRLTEIYINIVQEMETKYLH